MKSVKSIILIIVLLFSICISSCEKCNHEYELARVVEASCEHGGYKLNICTKCNKQLKTDIVLKTGHIFSNWQVVEAATSEKDGLEKRICEVCFTIEERSISSFNYIDLSIIKENINLTEIIECDTMDYLQIAFDSAILNNLSNIKIKLNFSIDETTILKKLVDNCSISLNYHVAMEYGDLLVLKFTYSETATTPTNQVPKYIQYNSLNYNVYESNRSPDFDDFKINKSSFSYQVETSSQLVYVLERGVKPIPTPGSSAFEVYEQAKKVLRQIIDDSMTDFEKIRAIHDYLIMNVTYDAALYDLFFTNPEGISKYNGFYLEGVFTDKLAVCEGISKAFSVLCNIEGIKCVVVTGYQTELPNGAGHAWNKVYLDGKWYIVDTTSDGTIINSKFEILSYEYFLIDEKTMEIKYTANEYKELVCDTTYNIFKNISYKLNDIENDFYVESFEELVDVIKYYETLTLNNKTIQFYLAFDYGTSCIDEIQNAYLKLHLPVSFSHIIKDNIITIIKE